MPSATIGGRKDRGEKRILSTKGTKYTKKYEKIDPQITQIPADSSVGATRWVALFCHSEPQAKNLV